MQESGRRVKGGGSTGNGWMASGAEMENGGGERKGKREEARQGGERRKRRRKETRKGGGRVHCRK